MLWRSAKFLLLVGIFASMMTSLADAQVRSPQKLGRRLMQWSGYGWGPGYHSCRPGPDTSYYQTWTAHNSFLLSEQFPYNQTKTYSDYGVPSGDRPNPVVPTEDGSWMITPTVSPPNATRPLDAAEEGGEPTTDIPPEQPPSSLGELPSADRVRQIIRRRSERN
jgi:hypothetical protein